MHLENRKNEKECTVQPIKESVEASLVSSVTFNIPVEILSDDAIKALTELGEVIKSIRRRLISEGYVIIDGKIKKPDIIEF